MGDGREVHKGGDICMPMADLMSRFDRKQQNSVKQLFFNEKSIKNKVQTFNPFVYTAVK